VKKDSERAGVSIDQVARAAGVSPTSVSHVLTGARPVSDDMRARVLAAVEKLGYVPTHAAQSLANGASQTIAVLVPDLSIGFFNGVVSSVDRAAMAEGYSVLLGATGWDGGDSEVRYLRMLRARAVDGLIYATGGGLDVSAELANLMEAVPAVAVDEELPGLVESTVVSDNRGGGREVARHLAGLGHKKAIVLGPPSGLRTAVERCEGFIEEWAKQGCDDIHCEMGAFDERRGRDAIARLGKMIGPGGYSAVFAANDMIAVGVLQGLRELGLVVPVDCSVVGFDDNWFAARLQPSLTTVWQDTETLGRRAFQSVLAGIRGERQPSRTEVPVRLVARESSGPVGVAAAQTTHGVSGELNSASELTEVGTRVVSRTNG
jgi:DNA-binding LacI/PurR family transcriptional regulator